MVGFPRNDIMSLVAARPRYDLAESVGPDLRLGDVLDGSGLGTLSDIALGYGTAPGDERLRRTIADHHGVAAEDVVVTVGGMHALFLIAFALCDRDSEAVILSPVFPLARTALEAVGAAVRTVSVDFDRGYRIATADVARELSGRTRLVSLASPQNPSGVAIPREAIRDLLAVMAEKCPAAYLLLDETYRDAAYGDDDVAASAVTLGPKVVATASLSKCHGAPGLRLGWAVTRDAALREQLIVGKFSTVISCSAVDEALGLLVLQQHQRVTAERRRHLAAGLARVAAWVRRHGDLVEWVRPDAGALCCVRLRPTRFDDDAVAAFHEDLSREGVRVASGAWFGDEARVFRLGFGLLSISDLDAALERLARSLARTAHSEGELHHA